MDGVRRTQARLLLRPTARAIRWTPPLVAVALAALAVILARVGDRPPPMRNLPAAALLLAAGLGFVLDDPAAATTSSSPTPLLLTRTLRAGVAFPLVLAGWGASLTYVDPGWVGVSLTAGFLSACAVALGLAAVAEPLVGSSRAGLVAALGLIVAFVVVPAAFDVSLRLEPTSVSWGHLYGRWLLVAMIGLAAFVLASSARVMRRDVLPGRVVLVRPARARVGAG